MYRFKAPYQNKNYFLLNLLYAILSCSLLLAKEPQGETFPFPTLPLAHSARQIRIPRYYGAFNPSLIAYNEEEYLLTFRYLPNKRQLLHSRIGLIVLDKDFAPISSPVSLLSTPRYPLRES